VRDDRRRPHDLSPAVAASEPSLARELHRSPDEPAPTGLPGHDFGSVRIQRAGEEPASAATPAAAVASPGLDGFVKDSADLLPEHLKSIDELAANIALQLTSTAVGGKVTVKVTGHTDTTGTDKHNTGLGQNRAAKAKTALEAALAAHKVPTDQIAAITTESAGERRLAVPTKDDVDEPRNRRVEFEVTIEQPPPTTKPQPPKVPDLRLPPDYVPPAIPGLPGGGRPVPAPPPSRDWLKRKLEDDPLLRKLPPALREKAIDGLKDADETIGDKVIDPLPWDDKTKQAAKAAIKSILQLLKGKRFQPPQVPDRAPDFPPGPTFPKAPGETIIKLPPIRFNWP